MKTIKKVKYRGWNCLLQASFYEYGNRVALFLIADEDDEFPGEPVATCTVNIPEEPLADGEVIIKDYSENEGMTDFLESEGIVQRTGRVVESGYVTVPVCKLLVDDAILPQRPRNRT
jgi:hypothetical protein